MLEANPLPTPMVSRLCLSTHIRDLVQDGTLYQSIVGVLQYVTITRQGIAFSVNKVSQFMQNHVTIHWNAVKDILRYLKGTMNYGLHLQSSSNLELTGFFDSNWAINIDNKRSMTGFCIYLGNNLMLKETKYSLKVKHGG